MQSENWATNENHGRSRTQYAKYYSLISQSWLKTIKKGTLNKQNCHQTRLKLKLTISKSKKKIKEKISFLSLKISDSFRRTFSYTKITASFGSKIIKSNLRKIHQIDNE